MNNREKHDARDKLALKVFNEIATNPENALTLVGILTTREKVSIGRRLLIAQAILNGKTRMEIQAKLGISPNTFAQVTRWLESEFDTYQGFTVSRPIEDNRSKRSKRVPPFSYQHLKRSYPMHFLLFTIAEEIWKKSTTK